MSAKVAAAPGAFSSGSGIAAPRSRAAVRPSATTLSALVMPTTSAASYQGASPFIPCSFPAAVCAFTQYSQAFTPLTTGATISFSARVNSPGAIARFIARPAEVRVPRHDAAHRRGLGEVVAEPLLGELEELLRRLGILGCFSQSDRRHRSEEHTS